MIVHPARTMPPDRLMDGLRKAIDARLVSERSAGNLRIFNYTPACVYDRQWNEITLLARGLVLDVARVALLATPFPKFFNLNERPEDRIPQLPFEIFEKLDGSLIILFHDGEGWRTATRGSFDSVQARSAQRWIDERDLTALAPGCTYLAEYVGPSNRIVVRYEAEELILIAAYDADGVELSYDEIRLVAERVRWRCAACHEFSDIAALVAHAETLPSSEEGFVLRFANGFRLKIKGEQYRRIHALISRCTPLALWEAMSAGDDLRGVRDQLPDEFLGDFDAIQAAINGRVRAVVTEVSQVAATVAHWSDKDVGLNLKNWPELVRQFIFPYRKSGGNLLTGKAREALFRAIRPTGNTLEGYTPSYAINRALDASEL